MTTQNCERASLEFRCGVVDTAVVVGGVDVVFTSTTADDVVPTMLELDNVIVGDTVLDGSASVTSEGWNGVTLDLRRDNSWDWLETISLELEMYVGDFQDGLGKMKDESDLLSDNNDGVGETRGDNFKDVVDNVGFILNVDNSSVSVGITKLSDNVSEDNSIVGLNTVGVILWLNTDFSVSVDIAKRSVDVWGDNSID